LQGKTHEQAAQELGWPLGTVKGRLARARDLLRQRLVRRGVTLSTGAALGQVPADLLGHTVRAAVCFARGPLPPGAVSAQTLALAKGALSTMTSTKLPSLLVALLLAALLVASSLVIGTPPARREVSAPAALAPAPAESSPRAEPLPPGAAARMGSPRFR